MTQWQEFEEDLLRREPRAEPPVEHKIPVTWWDIAITVFAVLVLFGVIWIGHKL